MIERHSTLKEVISIVPFLRRYARALCGDRSRGDDLVASMLGSVGAIDTQGDSRSLRLRLFSDLTRKWDEAAGDKSLPATAGSPASEPFGRKIASLSDRSRQAFLLVSMEEFSTSEAAQILDLTKAEFAARLKQARKEVSNQLSSDVLIIEDELFIATDIERIMEGLGHNVIGIERTRGGARIAAKYHKPSLVLADIKLADESGGIDAVNDILEDWQVPVVFITAYPERLLTGVCPEPTYLIIKPFTHEHVRAVVSQALFMDRCTRP